MAAFFEVTWWNLAMLIIHMSWTAPTCTYIRATDFYTGSGTYRAAGECKS